MKDRKNLLAGNCRKNKMVLGLKWPLEIFTFKNLKPQFLILQPFGKNKLKLFAPAFLAFSKNFCIYCQAISPCKADFRIKLSFAGRGMLTDRPFASPEWQIQLLLGSRVKLRFFKSFFLSECSAIFLHYVDPDKATSMCLQSWPSNSM